jgi:hypothetical protein
MNPCVFQTDNVYPKIESSRGKSATNRFDPNLSSCGSFPSRQGSSSCHHAYGQRLLGKKFMRSGHLRTRSSEKTEAVEAGRDHMSVFFPESGSSVQMLVRGQRILGRGFR